MSFENVKTSRTMLAGVLVLGLLIVVVAYIALFAGSDADDDANSDVVVEDQAGDQADGEAAAADAPVADPVDDGAGDGAGDGVDAAAQADGEPVEQAAAQPDASGSYVWEEYGLTFELPESWQGTTGSQDHDVALVSPEALTTGVGSFVTLRGLPYVGDDAALAEALEPLATDLNAEVEPTTVGTAQGYGITRTLDNGDTQWLLLVPYDEQGGAIYLTAVATPGEVDAVTGILGSMTVDIPSPDYAAINAAWQSSLEADDRLVYGSAEAPIEMVEFLSMTCGHCATYSRDVSRMAALDVETGRVQLEIVLIAGDDYARYASHATLCATEQRQGYSAYQALFQGYFEDGPQAAYTAEGAADRLAALDLDMDALDQCIADETYGDVLDAMRTRFYDNGLSGTPTIMLAAGETQQPQPLVLPDGQVWSGAIPMEILRDVFDLLLDGVPLSEIFDNLQ